MADRRVQVQNSSSLTGLGTEGHVLILIDEHDEAHEDQHCLAHFNFSARWSSLGTFCKTKIAIFVKARGRGAKKMAHVREYPHESSCGRPSSRTNFSFRDRTFVG